MIKLIEEPFKAYDYYQVFIVAPILVIAGATLTIISFLNGSKTFFFFLGLFSAFSFLFGMAFSMFLINRSVFKKPIAKSKTQGVKK